MDLDFNFNVNFNILVGAFRVHTLDFVDFHIYADR